jgi:CelD/BcsL family acetyltransferase involved in cellulose biosynthesis
MRNENGGVMRWELIEGVAAARARRADWDRLWERSDEASPAARCEPVCRWHAHFHPKTPLQVIAVSEGNELLAVLPLAPRGWPRVASLPSNDWVAGGTLLTDPAQDATHVSHCLLEGLARLPCVGYVFRGVPSDQVAWQALAKASIEAGWPKVLQPLHQVGTIDLQTTWEETETRLGGNYRRQMAKAQRRLEAAGRLEFHATDTFADGMFADGAEADGAQADSLESTLREGFELEARGWKGAAGTAIARQPGLMAFVVRHAAAIAGAVPCELRPAGDSPCAPEQDAARVRPVERPPTSGVRIATLRLDGRLIAFLYCWQGKRTVFTPKIAYDESFAEYSPGKLVFYWNLRALLRGGRWRSLDMAGPLADYNAKWATGSYSVSTLVLGKPGFRGQLLTAAYKGRRRLRDWRKRHAT